jgi:hypothetical protein
MPHAITVSAGKVFNVADDYFNDGFIPPSPLANFGFPTAIVPFVRADGGLDVAWLDYTSGASHPFGLDKPGMIYLTHIEPDLTTSTTTATGIQSYILLGFAADPVGNFYVAYNADHPFKNSIKDDPNNVNGNELRIAKASGSSFASKLWDTLVFGDQDNTKDLSKGNPGAAGSGVLAFDAVSGKLVLYVAHQMAWGDNGTRHQAGYIALIDPATGQPTPPGGKLPSTLNTGAGWFYSHDFNQRLLVDGGKFYMLAHGDAYPRQLGFAAWSVDGYTKKNAPDFDQSYFKIAGMEGDNQTDSETGQMVKVADGRFAIVHTTAQGRAARDVRIVLASATNGMVSAEAWLTTNATGLQATMPKVELLGQTLLVSYGLWSSSTRNNKKIDWYFVLLDQALKPLMQPKIVPGIEFTPSSPAFRFAEGPNAGNVGWISGNANHTLSVNVASGR